MSLPTALSYAITKPAGFPSYIRNTTFTPTTIYNNIALNDTVRIELKSRGFLDPYTTMVNIDVMVDNSMIQSMEIKKIDQSGQSLFSDLVISSRGTIIENVRNYDVLASILHDMNYALQYRRTRGYEGHADRPAVPTTECEGQTAQLMTPRITGSLVHMTPTTHDPLFWLGETPQVMPYTGGVGQPGVEDTFAGTLRPSTEAPSIGTTSKWSSTVFSGFLPGTLKAPPSGHLTTRNYWWLSVPGHIYNCSSASLMGTFATPNRIVNQARYELLTPIHALEAYEPADGLVDQDNVRSVVPPTWPNMLGASTLLPDHWTQYTGYVQPHVPNFADGAGGEPYFAGSNIRILQMVGGKPQRTAGRTLLSFSVPLLSSIFGALLPPDTYKLIPLAAFDEIVFEFKLNPFAFFTSGYQPFPSDPAQVSCPENTQVAYSNAAVTAPL